MLGALACFKIFVYTFMLWKVSNFLQKIRSAKKNDSQKTEAGKKTAPQRLVDSVCEQLLDEGIFNHVSRITFYLLIVLAVFMLITTRQLLSGTFLGESTSCMVLYLLAWCYVLLKINEMKYLQGEPTLSENYLFTAKIAGMLILIGLVGYLRGPGNAVPSSSSESEFCETCLEICRYQSPLNKTKLLSERNWTIER